MPLRLVIAYSVIALIVVAMIGLFLRWRSATVRDRDNRPTTKIDLSPD